MILALDTNVLVELLRKRPNPVFRTRLNQAREAGVDLRVSSVALHELMVGAFRSDRPDYHLERIDALISDLSSDPWTAEEALVAGRLCTELDAIGRPIGVFDVLIAAHAIRWDAVLVTGNLRHFARIGAMIDGLRLMDWNISDRPLDRAILFASLRRPEED